MHIANMYLKSWPVDPYMLTVYIDCKYIDVSLWLDYSFYSVQENAEMCYSSMQQTMMQKDDCTSKVIEIQIVARGPIVHEFTSVVLFWTLLALCIER